MIEETQERDVSQVIVGVDVGGTFIDLIMIDEASRSFRIHKAPSNRGAESQAFIDGLAQLQGLPANAAIVHGTTVGTNALLERKLARTGIIATQGFRDVLEMRRRDRPNTWGLWGDFRPVAERNDRLEVAERTLADGSIHTPLDELALTTAVNSLRSQGVEAIAIAFINAWANPAHGQRAARIAREIWPDGHIVAAHEIMPEIREFERTSTAVLNAALQPVVGNYLSHTQDRLRAAGKLGSFHIVQSNGGVMSVDLARRLPVRTALSGPAAGVIAARAITAQAGFTNAITADLGGTSFDVSLIADGQSAMRAQASIDFGLIIRTPMVEITTIGAGGGSIAHVDQGGFLQVGPRSAGSIPGPVCYGDGGNEPTLTDAHVLMGLIDASRPMGGRNKPLDREAALDAIARNIALPLGLEPMQAAEAIVRIADARMSGAIRLITIERGHDPKNFVLVPFGGGGALHVCALMENVGLKRALVPRFPGITSALGCAIADLRHDAVQSVEKMIDAIDLRTLQKLMEDMRRETTHTVYTSGVKVVCVDMEFTFDMHYLGQTHSISAALPVADAAAPVTPMTVDGLLALFEDHYLVKYSRLMPGTPIKLVNVRATAIGRGRRSISICSRLRRMPASTRHGANHAAYGHAKVGSKLRFLRGWICLQAFAFKGRRYSNRTTPPPLSPAQCKLIRMCWAILSSREHRHEQKNDRLEKSSARCCRPAERLSASGRRLRASRPRKS